MGSLGLPFVSVVIPVFNDAVSLRRCLAALESQTYPPDAYEVIVVDNGSAVDMQAAVGDFPGVTLLRQPRPGSYAARNRGLMAAKGPVVALTDADCIPDPDWIEAGVAALRDQPEAAIVGGHVQVFPRRAGRMNAAELYQSVRAFPQQHYVERARFAATANVFTFKSIFEAVGLFDDQLFSGGDKEWGRRVHRQGYALGFAGRARVRHPARETLRELVRKVARVTGGDFRLRQLRGEGHGRAAWQYLRTAARRPLVQRPIRQQLGLRRWLVVLSVDWALDAVRLAELLRLRLGGAPRRH